MRPNMKKYENKIKMRYQIDYKEKAYIYCRGYITGLNDSKAISTSEGMQLIDLNNHLRG